MKRIICAITVIAVFALIILNRPSLAAEKIPNQATPVATPAEENSRAELDDLWDTIDELEARVDELEAEVADLRAQLDESGDSDGADMSGPTHTVELTLTLMGYENIIGTNSKCRGDLGYDDLRVGATVKVFDQDGSVIASASITGADGGGATCELTATIDDVPEVLFYTFQVGHRDGPSFSIDEMEDANWTVELSIGD